MSKTILLVDDDPDTKKIISEAVNQINDNTDMSDINANLVVCCDTNSAIKAVRNEKFDLVFLDDRLWLKDKAFKNNFVEHRADMDVADRLHFLQDPHNGYDVIDEMEAIANCIPGPGHRQIAPFFIITSVISMGVACKVYHTACIGCMTKPLSLQYFQPQLVIALRQSEFVFTGNKKKTESIE